MTRQDVSRALNRLSGGSPGELLCTRVYFNARVYGGFWKPARILIDLIFYRDQEHCRQCYLHQMRGGDHQ